MRPVSYVLPVRWTNDADLIDLTAYLRWLSERAEVIVVDGSPPALFAGHHAAWQGLADHIPPDPDLRFANGKVNGVISGIRRASHEAVVIADDDVRYDGVGLARMIALLDQADLARPQNYFQPLPWHARWDSARTLLNRAFGADHPGTLGVRRSIFRAMGGYDGDCLFENLELARTVVAVGGSIVDAADLYIARRPPTAGQFWGQRVRQAYDDFAQPLRMGLFLAVGPVISVLVWKGEWRSIALGMIGSIAVAERGRWRAGGRAFFPASVSLFAPVWIAERAFCSWIAVCLRFVRGGISYGQGRIRTAAHSLTRLQRAAHSSRDSLSLPADVGRVDPLLTTPPAARNFTSL